MSDIAPDSLAIAGAWGYIGRKFFDAAGALGASRFVLDPAPVPGDVPPGSFTPLPDAEAFATQDASLHHLALHPGHRDEPLRLLLARARDGAPVTILNEKPMAPPEDPAMCDRLVREADAAGAWLFFDFPELYDPITRRIEAFFARFSDVRIESMYLARSKDREDPRNPRNYKVMVPIQYQESVHSIAFALWLLARVRGGARQALEGGVSVQGQADPYDPPNPEDYDYPVDGRCHCRFDFGGTAVEQRTDFKRGAEFTKQRLIHGTADGRPFEIDCDFLEGAKYLRIDGVDQGVPPDLNSYEHVLRQLWGWRQDTAWETFNGGTFPNARFARLTYLLSSMLWDACHGGPVAAPDAGAVDAYRPGFPRVGVDARGA